MMYNRQHNNIDTWVSCIKLDIKIVINIHF